MGLAEAREALGGAHGDTSKVPQERGVHPVNLTALGTKSHAFGPKGSLAQAATSEGVFYPEFTARVCFCTCAGFSCAGRLSLRRHDGKLICCHCPGASLTVLSPAWRRADPGGTKSLTQVLQRAMSKTNPQLLSSPCKMVLIMAPWQGDCKL